MTVKIKATRLRRDQLPTLLCDCLDTLLGTNCRVLDASPPWADSAIFALDGNNRPVLVEYDHEDSGRALLSGFATLDKLERELHWLARSYSEFSTGRPLILPDLVTVSPSPPPGAIRLCSENPWLRCFTFRALQVNGEAGLLLEPVTRDTGTRPGVLPPQPGERQTGDRTPPGPVSDTVTPGERLMDNMALSDDEEAFFRHL